MRKTFTVKPDADGNWPSLHDVKRAYIKAALERSGGHRMKAAHSIKISKKAVYSHINAMILRGEIAC